MDVATKKPEGTVSVADAESQLNKDIAKYENAKEAFGTLKERLESEFEANLDSSLSDEERDIMDLDGDTVDKYKLIMEKHKAYVDDKIEEERLALEQFEDDIERKQQVVQTLKAEEEFKTKNPDSNFEEVSEFFNEDMTARERNKLIEEAGGDHEKLMTLVHDAYVAKNGGGKEEEAELPTDLSGVAGETGDIDSGDGDARDVGVSHLYE